MRIISIGEIEAQLDWRYTKPSRRDRKRVRDDVSKFKNYQCFTWLTFRKVKGKNYGICRSIFGIFYIYFSHCMVGESNIVIQQNNKIVNSNKGVRSTSNRTS